MNAKIDDPTRPTAGPDPVGGRQPGPSGLRLALLLGVLVILGIPFVAILWETVNELLAGQINGRRLLIAMPVLLVFLGLMTLAARTLARHDRTS